MPLGRAMRLEANPTRLVVVGLVLIGAALAVAWFLRNFERRPMDMDVGWSLAARRNPFLAAESLLRRLGHPVEAVAGRGPLRDLPPTRDLLVVNGLGPLNQGRRAALQAWVEAGGELLVTALEPSDGDSPRPDDFLAGLGVRLREAETPGSAQGRVKVPVTFTGEPLPLNLSAPARLYLEDTADRAQSAALAEDGQARLLQVPLGRGHITLSADNRFLTNAGIGEHDHAALLARLAAPADGGKVWLLYDSAVPGLLATLWRAAPQAVLAGALLALGFVWHLGRRLGPLEPQPERGRRDLMEHLEAGAGFLWREGRAGQLSAAARGRVEGAWLRRHPPLRALGQGQRAAWIAARLGLAEVDVERALYTPPGDAQALVTDGALLQRIWVAAGG